MVREGEEYQYSSLNPRIAMDELPQRLNPGEINLTLMHR
jgi:hypothetical protein